MPLTMPIHGTRPTARCGVARALAWIAEAPSLGAPVLGMRENTERPRAVDAGTVKLIETGLSDVTDCTPQPTT